MVTLSLFNLAFVRWGYSEKYESSGWEVGVWKMKRRDRNARLWFLTGIGGYAACPWLERGWFIRGNISRRDRALMRARRDG